VPFDASVTCDATTVTVHTVLTGIGADGVSVTLVAGVEVWLKLFGVPVGHSSLNAEPVAFTDCEKLIVIVACVATPVAPFVGVVEVTCGAAIVWNENE
jgi:hypothetical protein